MKADKLLSGKFWLAIITGLCLLVLTTTVGMILWSHSTSEVNGAVMTVIGIIATTISSVITSYFRKKEDT